MLTGKEFINGVLNYSNSKPLSYEQISQTLGLTIRQYYAGLAMQGILSNPNEMSTEENIAKAAIIYADALIKELNKE